MLGIRGANLSDAVRVHMRKSLFWTQHFRAPLIIRCTHQVWNNASEKLQQMQPLRIWQVIVSRNISFFLCTPQYPLKTNRRRRSPARTEAFASDPYFKVKTSRTNKKLSHHSFPTQGSIFKAHPSAVNNSSNTNPLHLHRPSVVLLLEPLILGTTSRSNSNPLPRHNLPSIV